MMARMKATGKGVPVIAREVALTLSERTYLPVVGAHTQGGANVVADCLSHKHAPGHEKDLVHPLFVDILECHPPPRDASFFLSLCSPSAA